MTTTHLIGLHVELPRGHDQHAVVEAAAQRGVGRGVTPPRGPPALVLGFARLPEHRIAEAVRLLAEAAAATRAGRAH
jgi:GntR family transcriptional regulator/MocR family aminotransferase